MKTSVKALLACMIVISMVLSPVSEVMPTIAVAEQADFHTEYPEEVLDPSTQTVDYLESTDEHLTIIREDLSLRGSYEKHFLMSDGSYQVALYNEPVHQSENGKWVEIDNTLKLSTAADGIAQYTTANGLTDVSFSRDFREQMVTVRQGDYSVSWGVQAITNETSSKTTISTSQQPVIAELVEADHSALSVQEQKLLATKSTSTIRYRDALHSDVDLEYIILPSRVKENIILNNPKDISGYVVTVHTENLSARLLKDRRIQFYNNSNSVIFTIESPYMYDSAGVLSEEIAVKMASGKDGCYFITITPDDNWLNDEDRVYPVVIDPVVSTDRTQQNIIDNYVLEGSGVQNNNLDRLYIGKKSGKIARDYIKFSAMPTIPAGSTITAATMTVYLLSGTSTANTANAYRVTGGNWSSGTITWDNKPSATTLLASGIGHNNKTYYSFSCKTAVQTWYGGSTTGQTTNYGIMLRYTDETISDYNSVYSADYSDETKRPLLTITYQAPSNTVKVIEGSTSTLTAPNVSGTITWSSSNTTIATVSTSGKVTGVKAGKTTISASVNGTVHQTYTVYVAIVDGVYYIKNNSTNYYLSSKGGGISDGTRIVQASKTESTTTGLWQLWKVKYLSSGYYSIRPMHKLNMGIAVPSSTVTITDIGTSDTLNAIVSYASWTISFDGSGYVFKNQGVNSKALASPENSGNGAYVSATTYASNARFRWTLEKVSSISNQVLLYDTTTNSAITNGVRYIAPGETLTLEELNLMPAFVSTYNIDQTVTWSVGNSQIATVNESTGAVTGRRNGRCTTITVKKTDNGVTYSKTYTIYVTNVPLKPQQMSSWCWAATAQMLALNYDRTITASQADGVQEIFGTAGDTGSTHPLEAAAAANYFLGTTHNTSVTIGYSTMGEVLTEQALINYIDNGDVVGVYAGFYMADDVTSYRMGGHAFLVYGYEQVSGVYQFFIYDPMPMNVGEAYRLTYAQIRDHYDNYSSVTDEPIRYFWDGFFAADNSYIDNTINIKGG